MAHTPPLTADARRFRWHSLSPEDGAAMVDLVRSLDLNPDDIATDFAISRVANRPWRLHLSEIQRGEDGQILVDVALNEPVHRALHFDGLDLPESLTFKAQP